MGLKKYEIITVGGDRRVRALRSWQVGDRCVNIGDIGGVVYDEKTLSQDGLCWLFKGNFGFPGARIGGDSIVDVGETALSTGGTPNVDILGSCVVAGSKLQFGAEQTEADAVVLTANDFEQGLLTFAAGANWETWKSNSPQYLRSKAPIFMGGAPKTFKLEVPGYLAQAYTLTREGLGVSATAGVTTGPGVTLAVPAAQYCLLRLNKAPIANIVPADATTAAITFTGTYETKLSIVDSRVEINPAISTATVFFKPGGSYTMSPGVKYPEYTIRNSKVSINGHATADRSIRLMGQIIGSTAVLDCTTENLTLAGTYSNVKNLTASGVLTANAGISTYNIIQATDCDNFAVSPTVFPGVEAAQTANIPFIFQGCNVPDGRFYHHAQIANTYKDIDFSLAQADLGKSGENAHILVSSEIEWMYRLYSTTEASFGAVVESYESIRDSDIGNQAIAATYGTTIYADAYLNGIITFAGANVIGNAVKKPKTRTIDVARVAVQGGFNTSALGSEITGVISSSTTVCVPVPFPIKGSKGLTVSNVPSGISGIMFFTTANNVIASTQEILAGSTTNVTGQGLTRCRAFLRFAKTADGAITPEDIAGVTVTTYNGCKIVNTKESALNIVGNVRVEDNATLIDTSVTGTGYFGGNSVIEAPTVLTAPMPIGGAAYTKDNAVFSPITVVAGAGVSLLDMKNNAVFAGTLAVANMFYNITMADNARFLGFISPRSGFVMRGNSFVGASVAIAGASKGVLVMTGKARIESGNLTAVGYITLTGNYRQTATKTWTGKRVIDSQDAPAYDNNVKTQYDF